MSIFSGRFFCHSILASALARVRNVCSNLRKRRKDIPYARSAKKYLEFVSGLKICSLNILQTTQYPCVAHQSMPFFTALMLVVPHDSIALVQICMNVFYISFDPIDLF